MKLLRKNSIWVGIVLAALAPVVSYLLLTGINYTFEHWLHSGNTILREDTILLTSVFLNLFIFIPYLKFDKYEKTGRGVLLVTFTGVVILFLTQFN